MTKQDKRLEDFKDVSLSISLCIGKKFLTLNKILKLKEGDLIEFDKKLEDYLDVYLNGQKFGIGELVIVNDKYSLRLVDLV
ncbi:surface presentation of antigens (SPOA) protein [Desulfurobacterium thermolithotrophum DSM 11699]|uniref:Flagellar motor switch protein FliN n=1 Tax=Desulfurobacterium thermolithotrophum (strain DSM 11699 / BSA) TaxID=868864 RepID=F0S0S1_DESTD|nr:FliM/FliN family flagellar motor switch protein [Desulfurobacterium thermolithotrophum]ADY73874.1 surface presentation of antigens (SPOA) protein [Desulfurobacterium thermolithotrophum DSM 11699]